MSITQQQKTPFLAVNRAANNLNPDPVTRNYYVTLNMNYKNMPLTKTNNERRPISFQCEYNTHSDGVKREVGDVILSLFGLSMSSSLLLKCNALPLWGDINRERERAREMPR